MTNAKPQTAPYPPFWTRLSVYTGNAIQITGLVFGAVFLYVDGHITAPDIIRILLMIVAWMAIYICCHAFAHYVVGRLVGIQFRGYGLRGTDHPEAYPPGLRQLMSILPCFTVLTVKYSMTKATPTAKGLMFAAGETSTIIFSIGAGWFAFHEAIPGSGVLFIVSIIVAVMAAISAFFPKGDYKKALDALKSPKYRLR